jgi:gag-polypeptide of LTR copia-type
MTDKIQIDTNTSMKLTPMLLNGKNYQSWSKSAIISLKGKGKHGYITGDKKKPDANSEEWEIHDNLIMSWLLNFMPPEISELFIHGTETSAKMWTAINKMFGKQNNFAHIFQIKHDIAQIKQNQKSIT